MNFFSLFLLVISVFFLRCKGRVFLSLSETPLFVEETRFGVVSLPYLGLVQDLQDGNQNLTLRTGDIVVVRSIRMIYDTKKRVWLDYYQVVTDKEEMGWTTGESLELFKYVQAARNYGKVLRMDRVLS